MGVVYEAIQESLGRRVALKVLPRLDQAHPSRRARFSLEARAAAARLHHPNIVPVLGVGEHEDIPFFAMQFIDGRGLDALLVDLRESREDDPRAGQADPLVPNGWLARAGLSGPGYH